MLYLKAPGPEDEARVMEYRQEFLDEGDAIINGSASLGQFDRYGDWLSQVQDNLREETVRPRPGARDHHAVHPGRGRSAGGAR